MKDRVDKSRGMETRNPHTETLVIIKPTETLRKKMKLIRFLRRFSNQRTRLTKVMEEKQDQKVIV